MDKLRSLAVNLDVVGHEMFHGVTDGKSRLEYQDESGALNESYSDLFGILISNFDKPNIKDWDWQVGENLTANVAQSLQILSPGFDVLVLRCAL